MSAVLKYDAARLAIAEAKTVDEVREWIDKAAAVKEYGRRIKDRQMVLDALEIRAQAKRRRGELLVGLKADGRLYEGKRKLSAPADSLTLEDMGISRDESSEEQALAAIDGGSYDRLVARCRAYAEANPEKHSINPLKPPPEGPINGARAIMGSRQEPDDSLDYFPTPPWATRALIERVLPQLGVIAIESAKEPACGEGHIAEVLREYCSDVSASDIFDYGYGDAIVDWLDHDHACGAPNSDWIITNPPFGDKAVPFFERSLDLANIGVALFVRLQWLEGIGRYEKVYRDTPPTIVAFFVERVPLCKGEWKPDGDTATAYVWLVWVKGMVPQAPFWIPPGQRESLTHPDDAERFTTHPVTKRRSTFADDGSPTNQHTGEIIDTREAGE